MRTPWQGLYWLDQVVKRIRGDIVEVRAQRKGRAKIAAMDFKVLGRDAYRTSTLSPIEMPAQGKILVIM